MSDRLKFNLVKRGDQSNALPFNRLTPPELAVAEKAAEEVYKHWDPDFYIQSGKSPYLYLAYATNTAVAQAVAIYRFKHKGDEA